MDNNDNTKKPPSRRSKYSRNPVSSVRGTSQTAASSSPSSPGNNSRQFVNEADDDVGAFQPTTRRSNTTAATPAATPAALLLGVATMPSVARHSSSTQESDSGQPDGDLESQMSWRGNNERIPTVTADEEYAHDLQAQDTRKRRAEQENHEAPQRPQVSSASQQQGQVPGAFAVQQGSVEQRTSSVVPNDDDLVTHISHQQEHAENHEPEPVVPEVPIAAEVAPGENVDLHMIREVVAGMLQQQRQEEPWLGVATAEVVQTDFPENHNVGGQEEPHETGVQPELDTPLPRKKLWQRRIFWVLCALALVGIIIGVAVPIASQSGSDENPGPPTNNPTRFPTPFPTPVPTGPSPPLPNGPWEQLGQDLDGKGPNDFAGWSVALSKDASVVAVGAPECNSCTSSTSPGYVVVYRLGTSSQSWTQMGQELVGQANGDSFGVSVSLNGVGSIIAIGSDEYDGVAGASSGQVQVFEYNSSTTQWELLGDPIEGESPNDDFGISVSLSESGLILAVGAWGADTTNGSNSGSVRLFQFNRNSQAWQQLGQTLVGQAAGDRSGWSVALSSSGMIVGIGARFGGSNNQGQVSVYQYNSGSSTWIPMGDPINGQPLDNDFGYSVSLDDSGLILAAGARWSEIGGSDSGSVTVFEFDNSTLSWTRRGQTLVGQASSDQFGYSVSLSRDGNVLAAGSIWNDGNGLILSGNVRIFEYDKTNTREWIQVGSDIQGRAANDWSGWSVSLSGNGTVVVIGGVGNNNGGTSSGHARVFSLN